MNLITAIEIATNEYQIDVHRHPTEEKFSSSLVMLRDGCMHKVWLSFDGYPFTSITEATNAMEKIVERCKEAAKESEDMIKFYDLDQLFAEED